MPIPFRVRHAEWIAGLLVVVTAVALLVALLLLTRAKGTFAARPTYWVTVEKGHGIAPGGPVKMLGIPIGSIDAVEITDDNRVRARLEIASEFATRIRTDSVARVEVSLGLESVLAGVGFVVTPGSAGAEPLPADAEIASVEPSNVSDLLPGLSDDPIFDDLEATVRNLRQLSDQLNDPQSDLRRALKSTAEILALVEKGDGTVAKLLRDDGELYDRIVGTMDKVDGTLDKTGEMMSRSGRLVTRTTELLDRADGLLDASDKMVGNASEVFRKMDPVMDDAATAMKNLDTAVEAFAETTKKLGALMVKMDAVVADMATVVRAAKKVWPIRRHVRAAEAER